MLLLQELKMEECRVRDLELAKYTKRQVLFGLSGRVVDRDILSGKLRFGTWKHQLLEGSLSDEDLPLVGPVTSVEHVKKLVLASDYPVAIIEEYENKKEVERIVSQYPGWKPITLYFSTNPKLQDKYPMLTKEMMYDFLRRHKIGQCIFGMIDHEMDRFIRKYAGTDTAKHLAFRVELEEKMQKFFCPLIANILDYPVMFRYLSEERIKELKTNFYRNKDRARSMGLSHKELIETLFFMNCMIENLNDRNNSSRENVTELSNQINLNNIDHNQRPAAIVEKAKKMSTREEQEKILKEIREATFEIQNIVMQENSAEHVSKIVQLASKVNNYIPEIKRMHHKVQKKMFFYVLNCQDKLAMGGSDSNKKFAKVCQEWAEVLKWNKMSNGERAWYQEQLKKKALDERSVAERQMMAAVQRREANKCIARAEQRYNDLSAQNLLTPEEKQKRAEVKEARRMYNKQRKIEKEKLRAQQTAERKEKVISVRETLQPDIKMDVNESRNEKSFDRKDVHASREKIYVLGRGADNDSVDEISKLVAKMSFVPISFYGKEYNLGHKGDRRAIVRKSFPVPRQVIYAANSRSRGRR